MLETRTLVLDDDPLIADVLVECLHRTVREVDRAVDCERALELFEDRRHSVVVLDLMMPKMDGFEVMRRIHQIDPHTQVVIVTGHPSLENAVNAVNQHAFGFLLKPILFADLQRLVTEAFLDYQSRNGVTTRDDGQRSSALQDSDATIEAMYREVARLSSALERSPRDATLQAEYRESIARLRGAQAQEAELASQAFRDNLALHKGMGYSSIEAARRVLDRDKDSA